MIAKVKISVLCVVVLLLVGCNDIRSIQNAKNQLDQIEAVGYNSIDDNIIKYGEYDYKNLGSFRNQAVILLETFVI